MPDGFDEAGFAYLPSGPFPELQDVSPAPIFTSLGGGWYSWIAPW